MDVYIHPSSIVDDGAQIGNGTKIWHFSHIYSGARIGQRCSFGQNTMVAGDVQIGNNVKVQNNVAIYAGTHIEDDVFLGPSCVLTNVSNPRSQVVRHGVYEPTLIRRGATIGANATIVCGTTIGQYSFVSAGAVVTRDTPDYALMMGVPARQVGWMSRHGIPLIFSGEGIAICSESGLRYKSSKRSLMDGTVIEQVACLDLAEDAPLPEDLSVGNTAYGNLKKQSPNRLA